MLFEVELPPVPPLVADPVLVLPVPALLFCLLPDVAVPPAPPLPELPPLVVAELPALPVLPVEPMHIGQKG